MSDVVFTEEGHIYQRGMQTLPSVTQVIKAVFPDELADVHPAHVENARERGIEVDRLLSAWLAGAGNIPADTREDSVELFRKLIAWWPLGEAKTQVILANHELAGTVDIMPPKCVYDLKTTYNVPKYAPLQLGGYCHLYEAEYGRLPEKCGVIHLTKRQAPKVTEYDVSRVVSEFRLLFDYWKLVQRYVRKKN